MEIAKNLAKLIAEKETSQRQVALKAGVSPEYISQILSGTVKNIGIEKIEAIAKALDVPVNGLLYGEPEVRKSSNIPDKLLKHYFFVPLLSGDITEKDFRQSFENWKGPTQAVAKEIYHPQKKYIAWKMKGKSLEPTYLDSDILIIELTNPEFPYEDNSTVVVAYQNGKVTLGHLKLFPNETVEFRPFNKELPALQGKNQRHIKILGGVRGLNRRYI